MGKASSAKKIKRVQQAGVSRAPGQRRNLGYPLLIAAILIIGMGLVFLAREQRAVSADEAPVANQDHWHAAFGVNLCGTFAEPLADAVPDAQGIHTHSDGLIHIHPFVGAAAGKNATFSVFADQIGIELGDGEFTMPDGTTYANGDDCTDADGKKTEGRVALYVWPPQATEATEPKIVTSDLGQVRFDDDGQAFVLAFVPEGDDVQLPPTMDALANPEDLEPGTESEPGSTDFTTTTVVEGSDSTDTTAPADTAPAETAPSDTTAGG